MFKKTLLLLLFVILFQPMCFGAVNGVWQGDDYKSDTKVLFRGATTITTDVMTRETVIKQEHQDNIVKVASCVEYNGKCEESEYFKVIIHDIN